MCGRITQTKGALNGLAAEPLTSDHLPRYNGAPSQDFWVIRQNSDTGEIRRDRLKWGFMTKWMVDAGRPAQINARAEGVATSPTFRTAYAKRRCLVPVDNFFEWMKIKGPGPKQPYAIAMADGEPFALAGIWTGCELPDGTWAHTFAIVTCAANSLVGEIHNRMPVIIPMEKYLRWLSPAEPDPADMLVPYPADLMAIWPISTRVNTPRNDDPDILRPI